MSVLQQLVDDYESKTSLEHIDVELNSGSLRVFYRPVMNVAQQSKIFKHVDLDTGQFDTGIYVTSLIARAMNEDGTKMFRDVERKEIENKVDHEVLQKIFVGMGSAVEDVDPKQ